METNKLVEYIGGKRLWVGWQKKELDNGKTTKIPIASSGTFASSSNSDTWMTYSEVLGAIKRYALAGKGVIFDDRKVLVGVDLDNVLVQGGTHFEKIYNPVREFIEKAKTYTEYSPSMKGLHLYFHIDGGITLEQNKHKVDKKIGYEVYSSGRFFTVTETPMYNLPVRRVTKNELVKLLGILGYPWRKGERVLQANNFALPVKDDQSILNKAFESKYGDKIKSLYNGDISGYSDDHSSADLAFCSYIAFFSGARDQVERIWLGSALGNRKKTQEREDYRMLTIDKAFQGKTEFYNPVEISKSITDNRAIKVQQEEAEGKEVIIEGLITDRNQKVIVQVLHNVALLLKEHPLYKDRIKINQFDNTIYVDDRKMTDADVISIQAEFQKYFEEHLRLASVNKNMMFDALVLAAKENAFHPIKDWLATLEWDGEPRLDDWIDMVCGSPENDYQEFYDYRSAVARNTIKAMVGRILNPGCKYDYIFVLEGKQGCGKSTLLSILSTPEYRLETNTGVDKKDFYMDLMGKWVVELAEGEALSRSSVQTVKAMASRTVDTLRKPYGRVSEDTPRQFILAMTTNETTYLKDKTGNRRFLPIKVYLDFIDINWLLENRDQIFAEALTKYREDPTFLLPTAEAQKQQSHREEVDILYEEVEDAWNMLSSHQQKEGVTVYEVWEALERNQYGYYSKPQPWESTKISNILKSLGLQKRRKNVIISEGYDKKRAKKTVWYEPKDN